MSSMETARQATPPARGLREVAAPRGERSARSPWRYRCARLWAKTRVRMARLASRLILGRLAGRMPKSCLESVEKWSYLEQLQRHIRGIEDLVDACLVEYDFPTDQPPWFRRKACVSGRKLFRLEDVVVSPGTGLVWSDEFILEESAGTLRRFLDWGDMAHEPLIPEETLATSDPVAVLSGSMTFYHWLLEGLPNFLQLHAREPDIKVVVPYPAPRYVLDAFDVLWGPCAARARLIPVAGPVRVKRLVLAQVHNMLGFTHPADLALLRAAIEPKSLEDEPGMPARLYVSRRRAPSRRLAGEAILETALRQKGFTVLYAEDLRFVEQVRWFHRAEIVVGLHGAGLSNLVWARPPCRVLEIFPAGYCNDCFGCLAVGLGLTYDHVLCPSSTEMTASTVEDVLHRL